MPKGRIVFDSDRSGNFEIFSMAADGSDVVQMTNDPAHDAFWARIAPDRKTVLFYRVPAGRHNERGEYQHTELWMMKADGTDPTLVLPRHAYGWNQHGHAEWSPDGGSLVMFAGRTTNPQIWVLDRWGRNPRQLTDEPGTNVDPAFSPDGRSIVYAGCPGRICFPSDQEIYVIPTGGDERVRLTDDGIRDHDPYYSPDGEAIAFLSQTADAGADRPAGTWNIRLMEADGSGVRLLTDDEHINSKPAWSPDGRTIYFHRLVYGRGDGFQVWAVDVATGVMREITAGERSLNEYPGV
ncbi:MAG: TolB family protein [Acidimicrobiia bacterium]